MTRYKLFLPSLLLTVKRTMVTRFPTTTKTQISAKALHIAMPSVLEGELPFAELDSFTLSVPRYVPHLVFTLLAKITTSAI